MVDDGVTRHGVVNLRYARYTVGGGVIGRFVARDAGLVVGRLPKMLSTRHKTLNITLLLLALVDYGCQVGCYYKATHDWR